MVALVAGPVVLADGTSNSFSVLGVGNYPYSATDQLTNLDFGDCNAVYDKFTSLGWTTTQYEGDVAPSSPPQPTPGNRLTPSDKSTDAFEVGEYDALYQVYRSRSQADASDFLWCMGHGGSGRWYLANAYYGQTDGPEIFKYNDVVSGWENQSQWISNSQWDYNLEWVFFNMCSVMADNNTYLQPWAMTMLGNNRVHSLFGYMTTVSGTNAITNSFLNLTTVNNSSLTYSWEVAAETNGMYNWAFLVHDSNLMDHFWGRGSVTADTTGSPSIYYYYDGARRLVNPSLSLVPAVQKDARVAAGFQSAADVGQPEWIPSERPFLSPFGAVSEAPQDPTTYGLDPASPSVITGQNPYCATYLDRINGKSLRLWASGALDYVVEDPSFTPSGQSVDQALAAGVSFIEEHGGLPADACLTQVIERKRRPMAFDGSLGSEETLSYAFEYTREIAGHPVRGFAGDRILVSVGPAGVNHYFRLWRQVTRPTGEKQQVISAQDAVDRVTGQAFGRVAPIARIDLVYLSDAYPSRQSEFAPTWVVEFADGSQRHVNALTGDFTEVFADWHTAYEDGIPATPDTGQVDPDCLLANEG